MKRILIGLVCVLSILAPAGVVADPIDPVEGHISDFRRTHQCGTHQLDRTGGAPAPIWAHGPPTMTVYLNKNGGTYSLVSSTNAGANDVARFVHEAYPGTTPSAITIPALPGDWAWTTISNCVRDHFSTYNVNIVETEPAAGSYYVEAVVGGTGTELGYPSNQLFGIAAADNFCGVTNRGVAFSFSETHRGVPQATAELCATIAHEIGHLLALEHETLATDLMSYVLVSDTSSKSFVNQNSTCGVYPGQPQSCSCSSGMTNSSARLTQYVGGGLPPTPTPPNITISEPLNNATVDPGFAVRGSADEQLMRAELWIDGTLVATQTTINFTAPTTLTNGGHTIEVRGYDLQGTMGMASVNVNQGQCTTAADCQPEYICNAGACIPGAGAPGGLGAPCNNDSSVCQSGVCSTDGTDSYCTIPCDTSANNCPADFHCEPVGTGGVCWPGSGDGGICSAGGKPTDALPIGLGIVFAVLLVGRRRRLVR